MRATFWWRRCGLRWHRWRSAAIPICPLSFPREGFALYADNVSILRESKHQELAYQFLDYLLEARTAAAIASEVHAATANAAARALLPEDERNNPILYPSAEVLRRGEWFRALSVTAQRLRDRYWTEIKSA